MKSDFLRDFLSGIERHSRSAVFCRVLLVFLLLSGSCKLGSECRASGQPDALAQSAGNYVITGFLQEIANPAYSNSSNNLFIPITSANLVPMRVVSSSISGSDSTFYSLIRQSIPAADPIVSGQNTSTPAHDGQSINPTRWNMPMLVNGCGFGSAAQVPNWVYVSGTGSPSPVSQGVNGRFAYNVYNIGGLLNANVAGYPSFAKTQMADMRGTVAGADLTQLSGSVTQPVVDALITFRNPQACFSGTYYADYVTAAAANGFLSTTATGAFGTYWSNYFTTRQGLLGYVRQHNPGLIGALPYLTTFSLATNAPTWKPETNPPGSLIDYVGIATSGTSANKDILSVRFAASGTVTHYDDNGNPTTYPVNAGDPLIQRRFSLAKLGWITHNGPGVGVSSTNTISAAAIQACFGLAWNPTAKGPGGLYTSPRWEYAQLSNQASPRILRLDEVAAANREPNFFELLKAGILWGSLGRDPGPMLTYLDSPFVVMSGGSTSASAGIGAYGFQAWSAYSDLQILQIGVNLIDQVTPGNFPNSIYSGTTGATGTTGIIPIGSITDPYVLAELQILNTVSGIKDVPYLYGFTQIYVYSDGVAANNTHALVFGNGRLGAWLQPSVWNPMAQTSSPSPTNYRLNTYGQGYFMWNYYCDELILSNSINVGGTVLPAGTVLYGPQRTLISPGVYRDIWVTGTAYENPFSNVYQGVTQSYTGAPTGQIYFKTDASELLAGLASCNPRLQPVPITTTNFDPGQTTNRAKMMVNKANNPNLTSDSSGGTPVGVFFPPDLAFDVEGGNLNSVPGLYADVAYGITGTYYGIPTITSGNYTVVASGTYGGIQGKRTSKCLWGGVMPAPIAGLSTLTFILEYQDPIDGSWRPYSRLAKWQTLGRSDLLNCGQVTGTNRMPIAGKWDIPNYNNATTMLHVDPRTDRFSAVQGMRALTNGTIGALNTSTLPYEGGGFGSSNWPLGLETQGISSATWAKIFTQGGFYYNYLQPPWSGFGLLYNNSMSDLFRNLPSSNARYTDQDLVMRPADGALAAPGSSDGCPIYTGTANPARKPVVLNRPFRSVAEMGYAFRDQPFSSLDFAPPNSATDSADLALLDLFCVNDNSFVAGSVNINSAPPLVLNALLAGTPVDDGVSGTSTLFNPVAIASDLFNTISTSGSGPLLNRADLAYPLSRSIQSRGTTREYANKNCREAPLRALVSAADTRTWNFLIDVVAQSGQMDSNAGNNPGAGDFIVGGQSRYWFQVAIDRYTGQVLNQTLESVADGPVSISLSSTSILDNLPVGTTVATLSSSESSGTNYFAYTLVSGSGSDDNSVFTISGSNLKTAAVFDSLSKSSYNIRLCVTDQFGLTYEQPYVIAVQAGPYSQWKTTNFGGSANDPAVAGDLVISQNDGLQNLLKYALGKSPSSPSTTGITVQSDGTTMTINYTRATAATDITMHAWWTNDVGVADSWSTSGVTETMVSDDGTTQQWQATVPVNSNPKMFMRLRVTRP